MVFTLAELVVKSVTESEACGPVRGGEARGYTWRFSNARTRKIMRICWAQYLFWFVIAVLGAGAMLSGCGQKGALYLPPDQQQLVQPDRDAGDQPRR